MTFQLPQLDLSFYLAIAPLLILSTTAMIALLSAVSRRLGRPFIASAINMVGIVAALAMAIFNAATLEGGNFLANTWSYQLLGSFGQILILSLALVCSILSAATHIHQHFHRGEIIAIWHLVIAGMLVMISTQDFITLFIGLEIASIGLYALIGYIKPSRMSKEGAVKYLVLGSFASAFMLFGISLMYAASGTLDIPTLLQRIPSVGDAAPWMQLGGLLTFIGLGFKFALAPFHMWAPDAYEAAPTGLTSFMATAVKVMVMIIILRLAASPVASLTTSSDTSALLVSFFSFAAVASLLGGSILALVQSSFKRMLAYSSVANAGYMAITVCALSGQNKTIATASLLFYLVSYAFIVVGAFAVTMWLEDEQRDNIQIEDLSGLAETHPWAAFALAASMFAFAGIPPTAGFMGKLFLFNAALLEGFYGLVLVGIVAAVISVYVYLRVIVKMYMSTAKPYIQFNPRKSNVVTAVVVAALFMTLLLGTLLPNRAMFVMKRIQQHTFQSASPSH